MSRWTESWNFFWITQVRLISSIWNVLSSQHPLHTPPPQTSYLIWVAWLDDPSSRVYKHGTFEWYISINWRRVAKVFQLKKSAGHQIPSSSGWEHQDAMLYPTEPIHIKTILLQWLVIKLALFFLLLNNRIILCRVQVGMLFVRCRGGISHSPEENVLDDDIWAAGLALVALLETFLWVLNTDDHLSMLSSHITSDVSFIQNMHSSSQGL